MDTSVHRLGQNGAGVHSRDNISVWKPRDEAFSAGHRNGQGIRNDTARAGQSLARVRSLVSVSLAFADWAAILVSALLAALSAQGINRWILNQPFSGTASSDFANQTMIWAVLAIAVCAWFALRGTYTERNTFQSDLKLSTTTFLVALLLNGFIEYATKSSFSRLWIVMTWTEAAILVPIARVQVRRLLAKLNMWQIGAVIMGVGEHSEIVDALLSKDRYVGYAACYRSGSSLNVNQPLPSIAATVRAEMQRHGAEIVILAPDTSEMAHIDRLVDALNSNLIPYVVVPPMQRVPFSGLVVQTLPYTDTVLLAPRLGLMSPLRRAAKRIFDFVTAGLLLAVLAPLFAVLALAISVDGGSPFYGHPRVGLGGRSFRCLKFRSMAKDSQQRLARLLAEDPEAARQWATNFKLDNDPRITRLGKFLRTTSLDELPQLINVVRGEMSLVGPRPVVAQELEQYYGEDAFYYRMVRPGITGLWQVSGRSDTSYERRVFLDAWYVRNWDHWTDLAILFNTVPSVLRRDGAR